MMDELLEWSIVDKANLDPEVNLQIEFLSWLNKHPDASRKAEPLFTFFEGLRISMCGLCWHLRMVNKVEVTTGSWKGRGPSFAVDQVQPIAGGRISSRNEGDEEFRSLCAAVSWKSSLDSLTTCQDDPLDSLLKQCADPKLRSEIRCEGFMCMEDIGVADSFDEVLDALYKFSAWYALSIKDAESEELIEHDPLSEMELPLSERIRYLKVQAEDAGRMCRIALEAHHIVSKAAAKMLEECFAEAAIVMPLTESNPAGSGSRTGLRWAEMYARSEAVREGFLLQWCRVDWKLGRSSCIDCEVDVRKLIVKEADEETAIQVGIVPDKPLLIRIDVLSESVEIRQDGPDGLPFAKNLGTDFLLPYLVKKHISSSNHPHDHNPNVLLAMLHEVASYLSHLGSICVVCTEVAKDPNPHFILLCSHPLCEATFRCWAGASYVQAPYEVTLDG